MGYDIVRPGPSDIEALFDLQTRSDISEYGEPDSELSDLQHEWAKINLEQDAWVVRGDPGKILAYGAIVLYQNDFRFDVYVDPKQADPGLAANLLSRCEARAKSLAAEE